MERREGDPEVQGDLGGSRMLIDRLPPRREQVQQPPVQRQEEAEEILRRGDEMTLSPESRKRIMDRVLFELGAGISPNRQLVRAIELTMDYVEESR